MTRVAESLGCGEPEAGAVEVFLPAVGVEVHVDVVRQITAAFSAADERLGGGHGLTTVTAYLADTAAPMLRGRFPNEALRQAAFAAVAELAYLGGSTTTSARKAPPSATTRSATISPAKPIHAATPPG